MGLVMLYALLFSIVYTAHESIHDCTGEECPVCFVLEQCEAVFSSAGLGVVRHAAFVFAFIIYLVFAVRSLFVMCSETPVTRKVQLNN